MQYIKTRVYRNYPDECFDNESAIAFSSRFRSLKPLCSFSFKNKASNDAFGSRFGTLKCLETCIVFVSCNSLQTFVTALGLTLVSYCAVLFCLLFTLLVPCAEDPCSHCGHCWIEGEQWVECRSCRLSYTTLPAS